MDTRREFIKKAGLLSGMAGMNALIPASIQRALAIDPNPGTTWQDAEHIVILMQENRSFDHCLGSCGVFADSMIRVRYDLPNGNPVWLAIKPCWRNLCAISSGHKRYQSNLDEFPAAFLEKPGECPKRRQDMTSG